MKRQPCFQARHVFEGSSHACVDCANLVVGGGMKREGVCRMDSLHTRAGVDLVLRSERSSGRLRRPSGSGGRVARGSLSRETMSWSLVVLEESGNIFAMVCVCLPSRTTFKVLREKCPL